MQKASQLPSLVSALTLAGSLLLPSIGVAQVGGAIIKDGTAVDRVPLFPVPDCNRQRPDCDRFDDVYRVPGELQRHDLRHENMVEFHHKVLSDGSIGVYFINGSSRCYGSRAVLVENEDSIGIAVVTGTLPNGPEVCTLEAKMAHYVLHTQEPIGKREIVALESVELKQ